MAIESGELRLEGERTPVQLVGERPRRPGLGLTLAERRLVLAIVDVLLINAALVSALVIWGEFPGSPAAVAANFKWFLTLLAVWLIFAAALDVYDPARAASSTQSLLYAGVAALLAAIVYLGIPWLTPPLARRLQAFGFVGLAVAAVGGWRVLYARVFVQPAFRQRVLVIGGEAAGHFLVRELHAAALKERANPFRGTGYVVVGLVHDGPEAPQESIAGVPVLTSKHNLVHEARRLRVNEILVSDLGQLSPALHEALVDCWELGLRVTPLSAAYERLTARLPLEHAVQDLSVVTGRADRPEARLYRAAKRAADLVLALAGVALVGLLAPWIGLANLLTSPGPLFYRQQRVGQGGRPFCLVKFRTMIPQAEGAVGARWAAGEDPRVTPVGRWLRRARLDELPQFINVLRGEMSAVGPRPERPEFVGKLVHCLPLYRARHAVRPGITGWAQVRYRYGNSVEDARAKLEYDLYYIKHAGFFLDLLIMLQTFPVMLGLKGL